LLDNPAQVRRTCNCTHRTFLRTGSSRRGADVRIILLVRALLFAT